MKIFRGMLPAVVAAATVSCVIPVYVDEGSRWSREPEAFQQVSEFAAGGVLRVTNIYGNIIIRGWDREELEVTAEETRNDSAASIPRVEIASEGGETAITAGPGDEDFAGGRTVHLLIRVPHRVFLRSVTAGRGRLQLSDLYGEAFLRLDDGDLRVENYSGSLDAEIGLGSMEVELLDTRQKDAVRLVLDEGPIDVLLEPGFAGRLEAEAAEGTVSCDFEVTPAAEPTRVSGTVGSGEGALVIVSARHGSVTIRKTK